MRLLESVLWLAVCCVVSVIGISKINEHIAELSSKPPATRYQVVDGQSVPFWPTAHRGEPIRIYQCPGKPPDIALAHEQITCNDPRTNQQTENEL